MAISLGIYPIFRQTHLTSSLWRPAHPDSVPRQCRGANAVSEPKHSGIDCSRGFEEATHSLQTRGKRKFLKMILGKMRDVMLSKTIDCSQHIGNRGDSFAALAHKTQFSEQIICEIM